MHLFRRRHRVPLILQAEVNECGLACLAMLASYYGKQIDIVTLRSRFRLSAAGASVQHLLRAAGSLDLQGRALKLELTDLPRLTLPVILHWDMDHFVVLTKIRGNQFKILDPAVGERNYPLAELDLHVTGIAIELTPLPNFSEEQPSPNLSLKQLLPTSRHFYAAGVQIFLLSLCLQILALLSPLFLQLVIDQGIGKSDITLVQLLAVLFLLVVVGRVVVGYVRGVVSLRLSNQLSFQLLGSSFRHLLQLPLRFFEKREMGDIVSRFSALENIKQLLTQEMITVVVDGIFSSITLIILFLYSPALASVAFGFMTLFIILRLMFMPAEKQRRQEALITGARQQSRFMENIRSVVTTKNFCLEQQRVNDWQDVYAAYLNSSYHLSHFQLTTGSVQSFLFGLDSLLTVTLGAMQVDAGSLTLGQLMSFIFLKQHFTNSVTAMLPKLTELGLIRLELERVADIIQQKPESESYFVELLQRQTRGEITVKALCFRYAETDSLLIDHLGFKIAAGNSVAIIGKSGCGKSTLLKLLLGLEQPESGEILIDGIRLSEFGVARLREQVAVITHNEGLLAGDLGYNIRLEHGEVDLPRLRDACEQAGVWELIQSLPLGFNTRVGEMGSLFSAGQVQRLLLARAFYRRPRVLVLDESLSHLGQNAAREMFLRMTKHGLTLLLVTHSMELADLADMRVDLSAPYCEAIN